MKALFILIAVFFVFVLAEADHPQQAAAQTLERAR